MIQASLSNMNWVKRNGFENAENKRSESGNVMKVGRERERGDFFWKCGKKEKTNVGIIEHTIPYA